MEPPKIRTHFEYTTFNTNFTSIKVEVWSKDNLVKLEFVPKKSGQQKKIRVKINLFEKIFLKKK